MCKKDAFHRTEACRNALFLTEVKKISKNYCNRTRSVVYCIGIMKITIKSGSYDPLLIVERHNVSEGRVNYMANQKKVTELVGELLAPVAASLGLELWDVEYVREGARQILRLTIDKPDGVTIDDCETFHRTADPLLDEADPIDCSYYLEVSSPGIERELKTDAHLAACVGSEVEVRLYAPDAKKRKSLRGILRGSDNGKLLLTTAEGEESIDRTAAAKIKTVYDFEA